MVYQRKWRDAKHAIGFAAACARCVLPFHAGDPGPVVEAIHVVEAFLRDEPRAFPRTTARAARHCGSVGGVAAEAAYAVVTYTEYMRTYRAIHANVVCLVAGNAAVAARQATLIMVGEGLPNTIPRLFAQWIARDAGIDLDSEERVNAAVALFVAGGEDALAALANPPWES
jgi:hypothetical protein